MSTAATASVAALQGNARQVYPETVNDALALLDERRINLSSSRTRTVNQLHALLRELMAGGVPTSLTPKKAAAAIRRFPARTAPDKIRLELAKELIRDVARFDEQLAANSRKITQLLDEHRTHLRNIDGVAPVHAARILGRSDRASRFPTAAAYANYTDTAPVQIASADASHHRLSRFGDRHLNSTIHTIAMIRMPSSAGRAFYDKKIDEGKSPRSAARALKRHLATHLWRVMLADEKRSVRAVSRESLTAARQIERHRTSTAVRLCSSLVYSQEYSGSSARMRL